MTLNNSSIYSFNFGNFRLDGGSMFGSVPKNLWNKLIPADDQNRITLASRSLIIERDNRRILIDCGMGDKWSEKLRTIYAIENVPLGSWPFRADEITDLVLTHLHFDHAGGVTKYSNEISKQPVLTFPHATIYLQHANWENARNPSLKERASYLSENVQPLEVAQLNLVRGDVEILPGIIVHQVDGHSLGQQWVEIQTNSQPLFFATDLIPTSCHLPLPYHMGYDRCAETVMSEKEIFLKRVIDEDAIVVFQHDPAIEACTVTIDPKGHYAVKEVRSLSC